MDRMIHDTCAWARSEHPGPGPIIPSFPPQTSILRFSGLPPDDLLTESTIRSFNRLFASPVCGLAWRKGLYEGDDVVGDEGASYDMAGWEHSTLSLAQELPSEGSDTTNPPSARSHAWAPTQPINPGMRAGARIAAPARTQSLQHHAYSNDSGIRPPHTLVYTVPPHRVLEPAPGTTSPTTCAATVGAA
ncbi:hypothetical protein EDB83DRAFT_2447296, partial [Lactarius deliciosus]